ncbi:myeloperoxidase-like isoform X2 [Rana temporaria]|nr:myeloperoxidase-like isoform X2 [Rana temporaria]
MKFLLICTAIILASMTEAFYNEGELTELNDNFLKDSVKQAKHLVDNAYAETRKSLKQRAKRESASFADTIAYVRQSVGQCRNAIRAADYKEVTLRVIEEKLKCIYPSSVNISDVLTAEQKEIISKLTGCAYQYLPKVCSDSPYRTINGECNNRKNPNLGSANTAYIQLLKPAYEDGANSPRGWTENRTINGFYLPEARRVSNDVVGFNNSLPSEDEERSQFFTQWGQFVDHDMTLAPDTPSRSALYEGVDCATSCTRAYPCFPLKIPENDPRINQSDCIPFFRSAPVCNLASPLREQMNSLTSFMDASQVYGSDLALATKLRNTTNNLGLLAVNQNYTDNGRSFLPFSGNNPDVCTITNPSAGIPCMLAGDTRVTEQIGITAVQTLFLREHNRIATDLHRINPHWGGEKLYQETRVIIGSILQKITYTDWLPKLLGSEMARVLPPYTGYNDTEDPRVSNTFANAFRMGHTMVYKSVSPLGVGYRPHKTDPDIPVRQTFFAMWRLQRIGLDPFVRGMIANAGKLNQQDKMMNDELRDHLFEKASRIALDLAAINMQRGRDHGLPGYSEWRKYFNLSVPKNQDELAIVLNNTQLAKKLMALYKTPKNIDLWIGGVSELMVPGGRTGQLMARIIGDQFRRTRDGDRFYYERNSVLSEAQRRSIKNVSMSHIICANTNITEVPPNVFLLNKHPEQFVPCSNFPALDLTAWKETNKTNEDGCKV